MITDDSAATRNFEGGALSGVPLGFRWQMKQELSEADRKQIFGWAPDIFGVGDLPFEWRLKDLHFIAYDGSYAASHVGTVNHLVEVENHNVRVCGVGGVTTRPEYQGQHLAQALLSRALEWGHGKDGAEFGFLFCFPRLVPFYQRQGWKLLDTRVTAHQSAGDREIPFSAMTLPLAGNTWPAGNVHLRSLPW